MFGGQVTFKFPIITGAPRTGSVIHEAVAASGRVGRIIYYAPGDLPDNKTYAVVHGFNGWQLQIQSDDGTVFRGVIAVQQDVAFGTGGLGVRNMTYGNSTDKPPHTFHGAILGDNTPGSFTIPTERFASFVRRVTLTGTQRITVSGTGRLRVTN